MKWTAVSFILCATLGAVGLAIGHLQGNMPVGGFVAVATAGAWLALRARWPATGTAALFLLAGEAALGIRAGLPPLLMLAASVAALCAWDLDAFERRLSAAGQDETQPGLERRHLGRLGMVAVAGFILAALTMLVQVRLSFGAALLLALLALVLFSQAVRLIIRSSR